MRGQYRHMGDEFAGHASVNHSIGEYVRGDVHTNTIEGYFSILKRGITGTYHHVSPQHLKRYLGEFDFRYNERMALGVDRQPTRGKGAARHSRKADDVFGELIKPQPKMPGHVFRGGRPCDPYDDRQLLLPFPFWLNQDEP